MTLYDYNRLSDTEQYDVLWQSGVHIGERDDEAFRYVLYQMFSFYVELKYDQRLNEICGKTTFCTDRLLEPYLNKIDISQL